MKNLLIPACLIAILISCDKEYGDLKYSSTIPGGCALSKGSISKSIQTNNVDTVTYSIINGNLDIFVGFHAGCCASYTNIPEIKEGTIFIKMDATVLGACNCLCYYSYDFKFTGAGTNYWYNVTINDFLTFKGEIEP